VGDVIEGASRGVGPIEAVCQMIKSAASANDLPADFLLRVIWQESRFKSDAIGPVTRSGARALGIAQFMPATAAERELTRPFDPAQALPKAAEFLRELRSEFGNIGLVPRHSDFDVLNQRSD
jgi:soluble lytic murein transglycosylase-like protein